MSDYFPEIYQLQLKSVDTVQCHSNFLTITLPNRDVDDKTLITHSESSPRQNV